MFAQQISSQKITINAPIELVWSILVDLGKYGEWNPFVPRMESSLIVGEPIIIYVQMNAHAKFVEKEQVTQFEPYRRLAWRGLYPQVLLKDERFQELEPLENGSCSYFTHETFEGLAAPLLMLAFRQDIQRGFDGVAQALKRRAEAMK